jgi:predicted RecA/RadA family phage recombinase
MTKNCIGKAALLAGSIFLACSVDAQHKHQPGNGTSDAQSPSEAQASVSSPQFKPIAGAPEGTREATIFTHALPRVRARLEIRTIIVPAGKPVTLVAENEGVFEIRAGSASDESEGKTKKLKRGEVWQVSKGTRVTLRAEEELAVVRAIYLIPAEN